MELSSANNISDSPHPRYESNLAKAYDFGFMRHTKENVDA